MEEVDVDQLNTTIQNGHLLNWRGQYFSPLLPGTRHVLSSEGPGNVQRRAKEPTRLQRGNIFQESPVRERVTVQRAIQNNS